MSTTEDNVSAWVCDIWEDAMKIDSYDEWRSVRYSLYGASQACIQTGNYNDYAEYSFLTSIAFTHSLDVLEKA